MAKINHSKFRNTGMLFELLIRQVTADAMSESKSPAESIIKKFFNKKTELFKENQLYQILTTKKLDSENKAEQLINTVLEYRSKLNNSNLRNEKYNLIKEIKNRYDIDNFSQAKIPNYKLLASIYKLFEYKKTELYENPEDFIDSKFYIVEHLSSKEKDVEKNTDIYEEMKSYEPDLRLLTYKILIEKFNKKYSVLSTKQQEILREYVNNITDTIQLKEYYNKQVPLLKKNIDKMQVKVEDQATQIKLQEISKLLKPLGKVENIKDSHMMSLLQYEELLNELRSL
jgi:hypothetical protein